MDVLLSEVARIGRLPKARLALQVHKEPAQEACAFLPGLVRDGLLERRVFRVEELEQDVQHLERIGLARPIAGQDLLRRAAVPVLAPQRLLRANAARIGRVAGGPVSRLWVESS